jgi:hypothetical protein
LGQGLKSVVREYEARQSKPLLVPEKKAPPKKAG